MAWTDPKTWAALSTLPASELNTYVRDNLNYLKNIADGVTFSGVRVARESSDPAISLSNSTYTDLTYVTETMDYGGWWSSGASATVPVSAVPTGFTQIAVMLLGIARFVSNGTGNRQVTALVNNVVEAGAGYPAINGDATIVPVTGFLIVEAGDTIKLQAIQSSGGALNVDVCNMIIVRFAPVA